MGSALADRPAYSEDAVMPPSRRCSTCRHFQPAPLWRKGWCRNPLLFAPSQNHLVDERELDCARPFGDYWEGMDETEAATPARVEAEARPAPPPTGETSPRPAESSTPIKVNRPPVGPRRRPPPVAPPRTQVDYLRFGVPVAVGLAALIAYVIWTTLLMQSASEAGSPTPTATSGPSPTLPPTTVATTAPTPRPTIALTPRPTTVPTAAVAASPATAVAAPATAAPGGLRPGVTAIVDTGSNDGLRVRRDPGQAGTVLRTLRNGERLTILDGPREVDGLAWYRVQYADEPGWVAGNFIKPAP